MVYHLHPTPSLPDYGLATPPISPLRQYGSPSPALSAVNSSHTVCLCGKAAFDDRGCRQACVERQRKWKDRSTSDSSRRASSSTSRSSPASPGDDASQLDEQMNPAPRLIRTRGSSSAGAALSRALTEDDTADTADIFPPSIYRSTHKPRSQRNSASALLPPERTATVSHGHDPRGPVPDQSALLATPDRRASSELSASEYSPMAAGFVRLSRERAYATSSPSADRRRGRRTSPSGELEARMFDGPA